MEAIKALEPQRLHSNYSPLNIAIRNHPFARLVSTSITLTHLQDDELKSVSCTRNRFSFYFLEICWILQSLSASSRHAWLATRNATKSLWNHMPFHTSSCHDLELPLHEFASLNSRDVRPCHQIVACSLIEHPSVRRQSRYSRATLVQDCWLFTETSSINNTIER